MADEILRPNPELVIRAVDMYQQATERIDRLQVELEEAARQRALGLALLYDHGMSLLRIGNMVGLTGARVGQLIGGLRVRPNGLTPANRIIRPCPRCHLTDGSHNLRHHLGPRVSSLDPVRQQVAVEVSDD